MAENTNPALSALPTVEELQGMTDEQVRDAAEAALAEASELESIDDAEISDEQVTRLEALADFLDSVDGENTRRETIANERAERARAARERLNRDPEDNADEDADEDPEDAGDDLVVEAEAVQPVAASGVRPRPARRRNPTPEPGPAGVSIVASADLGGRFASGMELEGMSDVAEAFIQRSKGFPSGRARQKNVRLQHQVVSMHRNFAADPDGLYVGNPEFKDAQSVLAAAASESRLKGGALVAAGGWCAPSETIYTLPTGETLDGIIDLPTIGVARGGINFTPGPDFSDIYATAGFHQTETEAIAGETKNCVQVDCPDFDEVRLDAVGFCVKAPLLTRAAYPEVVQRWLEGTIVANQHKVAASLIESMRTALGAPLAPVLTGTPITWGTLSIVEWVIEMQRQAYRLSASQTLEVKAPRWLKVAIRADLANRLAVGIQRVTDSVIADHFADRGAVVQWILNYLEPATPLTSIAFPATAEIMVYPAGTFVKGAADVVSLDTVYDTADLQTNVYTAAFVEDGVLLAKMKHGGARITLPVLVNGVVGAAVLDDNLFTAQAPNLYPAA